MSTIELESSTDEICARFAALRAEKKLRHRDAAAAMGLSEAEALAAHAGRSDGLITRRLEGSFPQVVAALSMAGPLMALTRNEAAVHERTGVYDDTSVNGHVGLVVGPDIDLRIFYHQWKYGFWVEEKSERGVSRSLQFFDAHGDAVHKIFNRKDTDEVAFLSIAGMFEAAQQSTSIDVTPRVPAASPRPDIAIDVDGLAKKWAVMTDTHEFFGLLKSFDVQRLQAVRLMQGKFTRRVGRDALWQTLVMASERDLEIMVFVPNPGCIQIHTGPVKNVQRMGPWANVLDPMFNLHLREDLIAEAYVVEKPTSEGTVTSLELYAADGSSIAWLFGKRKPGIPELEQWRALACALPSLETVRV
jgi:putative hemin transport protein